jgi:hypothetical protein
MLLSFKCFTIASHRKELNRRIVLKYKRHMQTKHFNVMQQCITCLRFVIIISRHLNYKYCATHIQWVIHLTCSDVFQSTFMTRRALIQIWKQIRAVFRTPCSVLHLAAARSSTGLHSPADVHLRVSPHIFSDSRPMQYHSIFINSNSKPLGLIYHLHSIFMSLPIPCFRQRDANFNILVSQASYVMERPKLLAFTKISACKGFYAS